jgi:hypothetical protein
MPREWFGSIEEEGAGKAKRSPVPTIKRVVF